jgi:hypothetical protein
MSEEAEINGRSTQVSSLLTRKDKAGALALALQNPPINSKSEDIKVNCFFKIGIPLTSSFVEFKCGSSRKSVNAIN